jgi:CheY-like chemotaxis protein
MDTAREDAVKVLVVDDDRELLSAYAQAVTRLGHVVAVAGNGYEAIAVAAEFAPDVAMVDVMLPDISGITLASVLRGVVEHTSLRVVGISGAGIERLEAASSRGVFDRHLAKPISFSSLAAALRW